MPEACLPAQFEVVRHVDETRAAEPLERTGQWDQGAAGTYPFGV